MYLRIWEEGIEFIVESLHETELGIEDATMIMENIADDMMYNLGQLFDSQGRRGGGSWAPLNEKYQLSKLDQGYDVRILFRTHDLVRSVAMRGADYQDLQVDYNSVYLTTELEYAGYHMTGTHKMPARPFLRFAPYDERRWAQMIAARMIAPMKRRRYHTYSVFEQAL